MRGFRLLKLLLFCLFALPVNASFYKNLPASKSAIVPTTTNVIYLTFGTLPTLYAGIHMFLHTKPTFMWFLRENTINLTALPTHVKMIGEPGRNNFDNIYFVKDEVSKILETDADASFTLYTDDMQSARIFLTLLVSTGVKENNYQVRILSDGTGTYNYYRMFFNTSVGFDIFNNTISYLYNLYAKVLKTKDVEVIPDDNYAFADLYNNMFALASFPFSELWLAYPDLLSSKDNRMTFARSVINVREVTPFFLFSCLSKANVSKFLNLFNFDKDYFDAILNNKKSDNQLLNAISTPVFVKETNPSASSTPQFIDKNKKPSSFSPISTEVKETVANNTEDNSVLAPKKKLILTMPYPIPVYFGSVLKKIINGYSENYDIYLKPHPDDELSDAQVKKFKEMGVVDVFGNRIPMEIILFLYPSVHIGGFQSSLYMSTKPEQILFFITYTGNALGLPEPLSSLYKQGIFSNVKFFMQPVPANPPSSSMPASSTPASNMSERK